MNIFSPFSISTEYMIFSISHCLKVLEMRALDDYGKSKLQHTINIFDEFKLYYNSIFNDVVYLRLQSCEIYVT